MYSEFSYMFIILGEIMYLNEAIERINNIKWEVVGTNSKDLGNLGYEFLRRLAHFFKSKGIEPMAPMFSNIAKLLGDVEEVNISDYCNPCTIEFCNKYTYVKYLFNHYLQLAKYADKNSDVIKYLSVYDPLIKVLERGGMFSLNTHTLELCGQFPLYGWYERFAVKEPIDSDNL
jgi:hypothetical protein